ncbi:glutamate synthase (NADPH) GltB3 subunit [Methanothermus fervidus DSM 2088]|uniref:Glutamate synthase (NADPH) GltB3 subunit n=1 Tax=Methanothermus fervidus (strain ATCC 43054 / DSM 2088 / JCM 10308 / V24 S) TaxID=523846 RepID=E3GWD3_METFV|nr:GXGXG domain-containing protein [Methanothermus fervidus]ADP77898.1 glutamate synthase (NADPH) GltB3 subunit [Methanothermus fervidus DSM 2088]
MKEVVIDAESKTPREVNSSLKKLAEKYDRIIIENPNAMHYLAAGLTKKVEVIINGSAGYFVGTMIHGPKIEVKGNAGWFPADNMTKGKVIIHGSAGDGVGQGIYGGTVIVKGDAGSRTGEIMKNGTIIIGGNSGFMTGLFMMGGRIVVLGDLGKDAGESIIRGKIYVRGEIQSLGKNARVEEINVKDEEELNKILNENGFNIKKSEYDEFKKIVPKSKRPFYGKQSEEG